MILNRSIIFLAASLPGILSAQQENAPDSQMDEILHQRIKQLSPADSIARIQLPPGYSLQPVLTEPQISEPVTCVFDGNGRMYVVQMNTYMQDADATGEFDATSRISMHEDTNGDGKYDKHSVFIDNLMLPRMILPLEDGIVVGITNTLDLFLYKDTDGDGVADKKSLYYEGGPRGGNMEHQPSGLIWSIDNWVYTTYNAKRFKFGPDKLITTEPTGANQGQWGLTQDNYGKPWFVDAGGEIGPVNFQFPIVYGTSRHFENQVSAGFRDVYPICDIPDVQGGAGRLKPLVGSDPIDSGKVLNHFTATCGPDVYRGDRLPKELYGNLFFSEPVGRLIRRAKVEVNDGVTHLSNADGKSEFIRSTDPNFRPINMVTAPDGTIYIVDIYRGIIQEGQWTKPGSYLRSVIDKYGLARNIQHGRIYRLVHQDFERGPKPDMIGKSSSELVKHLSHPNGWWRDTAQKFLVLRGDQSIASELTKLAASDNHLAQIHALWTLEGIGSLNSDHILKALTDKHPQVRRAAIRCAETLIKSNHSDTAKLIISISNLVSDEDPEVAMQVILTADLLQFDNKSQLHATAAAETSSKGVLQTLPKSTLENVAALNLPAQALQQHKRGKITYQQLCSACHGLDGKGVKSGESLMAPPLAGSASVNGHHEQFINILLHGLEGPINGVDYPAPMVSMKSEDDQWVADIATYIKNEFGNRGGCVEPEIVANVREKTKTKDKPWTLDNLKKSVPQKLTNTKDWKITASHHAESAKFAIDNDPTTRYSTNTVQTPGMWLQVELPELTDLASIRLDTHSSPRDFPAKYTAEVSTDGKTWITVQDTTAGTYFLTGIDFAPTKAKFFRITTKDNKSDGLYWSIHELTAFAN